MMMMMMMTVERREGANSYSRDAFPCALQTTGFSSFYMRRAAHAPPIQCGTLRSALLTPSAPLCQANFAVASRAAAIVPFV